MTTSGDTIDSVEEARARTEGPERAPHDSKRGRLAILVGAALVVGVLGRLLLAGGIASSFLEDLLPWLGGTSITLHFGEQTDSFLVPVSRTLSGDSENAAGLVDTLLAGPAGGTGLVSLIPQGTVARSVSIDGTVMVVDLSGDYLARTSPLADEALLQSLTSWPGVEQARVTIEGAPLIASSSTGHLLYFYDEARDMLVATPAPVTDVRDILTAYLEGPPETGLIGLPEDVEVLAFESDPRSGTIKINMTYSDSVREMATNDGDSMRRVLEGMIASLTTGFADTGYVYLDFEGHATLGLGQCANLLRRVQPPPEVLNDERLLTSSVGT